MDTDNSLTRLFARHLSDEPDGMIRSVEFGLVHHLTEQRRFSSVESLLVYCRDPNNLREFLPDRRDRTLFSRHLVQRLTALRGKLGGVIEQESSAGASAPGVQPGPSARPAV